MTSTVSSSAFPDYSGNNLNLSQLDISATATDERLSIATRSLAVMIAASGYVSPGMFFASLKDDDLKLLLNACVESNTDYCQDAEVQQQAMHEIKTVVNLLLRAEGLTELQTDVQQYEHVLNLKTLVAVEIASRKTKVKVNHFKYSLCYDREPLMQTVYSTLAAMKIVLYTHGYQTLERFLVEQAH